MSELETLKDKVQDLLALEVIARDIFADLLSSEGSEDMAAELTRLKEDEERHIGLVQQLTALLEGQS